MSNTTYNTGLSTWTHGETMRNDWHIYLGPCPHCGSPTFDYGGGWRCLEDYCVNSTNNPVGNLGSAPNWWNTGVQVVKDGNTWFAHGADFLNLQESIAGYGDTPKQAIDHYWILTN